MLDGDERRILGNLIFMSAAKALTPGLLHTGMDASSPSPDRGICFDVALILSSCSVLANRSMRGATVVVVNDGVSGMAVGLLQTVELRSSVSCQCVNATYPHTPAGCCHSRSHCGSSRCTWRRGLSTVRSCIFRIQTSDTRLHLRSERQF